MYSWGQQQQRGARGGGPPAPRRHRASTSTLEGGPKTTSTGYNVFSTKQLRSSLSLEAISSPTSTSNREPIFVKGKNSNRGRHRISLPGPPMGNAPFGRVIQPINEVEPTFDPTLDFPFLRDNRTKNFIRCSKVMMILRGLPGSGKTYLTQVILDEFNRSAVVCSADHYFNQRGVYRFNPNRLQDAHNQCQQRTVQAVSGGKHLIIIDNTNVEMWEMDFYLKCANDNDYIVLFVEPKTSWKTDVTVLSKVTRHKMEEDKLLQRKKQWESVAPLFYGWFLNYGDSLALVNIALAYFEECTKITNFTKQIRDQTNFSGDTNLEGYYNLEKTKSLHVTAKYLGNQSKNEIKRYQGLDAVKKAYGQVSTVKVIGFVLTPFTMGARVALSTNQLQVWGSDDEERPPPVQVGLDVMRNSTSRRKQKPERINQSTSIPTLKSQPNVSAKSKNRFFPTDGVGRRAHLTLGCATGVEAVQTGFDLLQAIDFEREAQRSKKDVQTYQISGALVRKYGEDIWVVYPDSSYTMDAMFTYYALGQSTPNN